ncbi:MAG: carbohydrate porin [Candidatus Sericytochromatia bacterium]|nr:carbohydrate porin [Candidatus Sericytochromatia bacterium]
MPIRPLLWRHCVRAGLFTLFLGLTNTATAFAAASGPAAEPVGSDTGTKPDPWFAIGGQANWIDQQTFAFRSPYQGKNSFRSGYDNALSHLFDVFVAVRPLPGLEVVVNPEMMLGGALSDALGLGGVINGDVIRNPGLGQTPYVARAFVRYALPLGSDQETVPAGFYQLPGHRPASRLQFTAGKLGTNDLFDVNSYAGSSRTQFLNWVLINSGAYDYAADTRGFSYGAAVEWFQPWGALRVGTFLMPTTANGPDLDTDLSRSGGNQIEVELHPHLQGLERPATLRVLGFLNRAAMGNYRQTLAQTGVGAVPDIASTRQPGTVKYGLNLNVEQPLADDGATGVFGRLGWNDGATESYAFTEADLSLSLGGQLSGRYWHRPDDRVGLAVAIGGLSPDHAAYAKAGGSGFVLGDGNLTYGQETILETYYNLRIWGPFSLSLDYQLIGNPGYNQDRGPISILGLRMHVEQLYP